MIKIIKGDLLSVTHGIIGQQVNCQGVMGSGVAKQIKEKYPMAFEGYRGIIDSHKQDKRLLLGRVNGVNVKNGLWIANMFGQHNFGYDGKQYTDVEALATCLRTVRFFAEKENFPVALPYKIGSDRGGADWIEVEGLIFEIFDGYDVTLYKL